MKLAVFVITALALMVPTYASETPATEYLAPHATAYTAPARPINNNPVPVWQHLAQLSPAERTNAAIAFDVESDLARRAEQTWNAGRYDEALDLVRELNPPDVGVEWRMPIPAPETDWGEPIQVSTRDSVYEVELVADTVTGNIFAFLLFSGDTHTSSFSVNLSTDGGQTWSETYDWWANYDIPSIGAAVVDDYAYLGVNRSGFAYVSLFRFGTSDGLRANFPGGGNSFQVADGAANSFEEVALAENATFSNNRIYVFYNTTSDSSRIVGFATDDFDTFDFNDEPMEVERGLDIEWNYYPAGHPLVFSYINPSSFVRVYGYDIGSNIDTLFALSHEANGPYTALTAWKDTLTVVFDQTGSSVTQVRYLVQYDTASSFLQGGIGDTTLGFSRNGAATGIRGDGVAVTYWQYPQGSPGQAYRYRNYSGQWTPPVSIQNGNTASFPIPAITRVAPGAYGVLFYRTSRTIVYYNRSDWTGIAEPRLPRAKVERRTPTIVRGMLQLRGSSPAVLLDASGRRVMDLQPGTNDLRQVASGVYFVGRATSGNSGPEKLVLTR